MTTEIRSFKQQIKEQILKTFGFAPKMSEITLLETSSKGLYLTDAGFAVNGKGYCFNRLVNDGEVVKNSDYDLTKHNK